MKLIFEDTTLVQMEWREIENYFVKPTDPRETYYIQYTFADGSLETIGFIGKYRNEYIVRSFPYEVSTFSHSSFWGGIRQLLDCLGESEDFAFAYNYVEV